MKGFLKISFTFGCVFIVTYSLLITNCFSQWVQQTVPVNKPITGIEFVDTLHGWACTSRGTPADTGYILYTTNGGTNWLVQLSAYIVSFTDLDMVNSLTGYASGNDFNIALYKLFRTTNGGLNWTSITMVPNMNIADIQFINQDSGWECGPNFTADVRTTTDGGNSWIIKTNGITQPTQKVFFLNYNTGFCGASFNLFKTTNAGLNWANSGSFGEQIYGIFFLDINTGWLAMTGNQVKYTTNAGNNWITQVPDPVGSGTIWDVYFINNFTGWAGTAYQKIYKTTNSGLNWGYQIDSGASTNFCFTDSMHGWSSGLSSIMGIYHTTNGGGPILGMTTLSNNIPENFLLYQNYPNPFNPETNIRFDIKENSFVRLVIFDVLGRQIDLLINQKMYAGSYEYKWYGSDKPSGVYFYQFTTQNYFETKKMILQK